MKFPGLISGCTIDWFSRWPRDALVAVARHFISNFEVKCTPKEKQSLYNVMGSFQVIKLLCIHMLTPFYEIIRSF